jgi:hypothetical protein
MSFVNSIINDEAPIVSGMDGLQALKVCESALESARIGKPIINNHELFDFLYQLENYNTHKFLFNK